MTVAERTYVARVRILSIDGGGVGGALPAALLNRLVSACPQLVKRADLIAGTSTGSLVSLCLADGRDPAQVVKLYRDDGPHIFRRGFWRTLGRPFGVPKYSPRPLRAVLRREFGDRMLGDLGKPVLVPVGSLERDDGVFLSTFEQFSRWANVRCVDAALASCAAPFYYPPHRAPGIGRCVDGGLTGRTILRPRPSPRCGRTPTGRRSRCCRWGAASGNTANRLGAGR
jgi:patatin-like phospholipase/acyl hydrolase